MIEIKETDLNGVLLRTNTFAYDSKKRLAATTYGAVGQTYRPIYEKNANGHEYPDDVVVGIKLDGKFTDKVTKDGLRRASSKTLQVGSRTLFSESYSYLSTPKEGKTIATEIVSSVASYVYGTSANSSTLNYTYDKAGNLETVSNGTTLIAKYYYDGLNRLKREDNHTAGQTYTWEYDVGGNILNKKVYALCTDINLGSCLKTDVYAYATNGWKDQLSSYNGLACEYDSMGNPIKYRDNTLTWTKVRRLASFGTNTFEYGANGIRYQKNNTVYTLDGNKILKETDGTKTLTYYHGGSGIIGFNYNGTDYYFRKNLQGDVTEIYTSAGLKVASYAYDAWGKVLSVTDANGIDIPKTEAHIANINPFRYRSYYYDTETKFYYLQSRYYDSEIGRFINADTIFDFKHMNNLGSNLMCYCKNNPCNYLDFNGHWVVGLSFETQIACGVGVYVVYNIFFDQNYFLISWGLGGQIQFNMSFGVSATFLWYPWMDSVDNTVGFSASTYLGVSIFGVYTGGGVAIDWASLNAGFSFSAGYMPSLFPVTYRVNVGWCWKIAKHSYKQYERMFVGAYKAIRILGKTIIEIRKATKNYLVFNLRGTNYMLKYWLKERRFVLDS